MKKGKEQDSGAVSVISVPEKITWNILLKSLSKSCIQLEETIEHTDGEYNRTLVGFLTLSTLAVFSGQRGNTGVHTDWTNRGWANRGWWLIRSRADKDKTGNPFSSVSSLMIWIKQMEPTANLGESGKKVRAEVTHQALEL